jgi:hypothetical protein
MGELTDERSQESQKSPQEIREEEVEEEGRKEADDPKGGQEGREEEGPKEKGGQDHAKEGRYETEGVQEEVFREAQDEDQGQDCVQAGHQSEGKGEIESDSALLGRTRSDATEFGIEAAARAKHDVGWSIVVRRTEL